MDKWERKHLRNTLSFQRAIEIIFQEAVKEAARIGASIDVFDPSRPFSFADYPMTKKRVEALLESLHDSTEAVVLDGIEHEWTLANRKNDELCNLVFGANAAKLTKAQAARYYRSNDAALRAFQRRVSGGLNLSDRVWNFAGQFKKEIEMGLDLGLRSGKGAEAMARELKTYLKHPDKLFRRVRDEHGQLHLSKAAKEFHPGQGVYRSSFKNARRLAVTETNMAYRASDYVRYQQLDFVVGIRIVCSGNHPVPDICDELAGEYPKEFKFTGWHPHCRCHVETILKTREEMDADTKAILRGEAPSSESSRKVKEPPETFKNWVKENEEKIDAAQKVEAKTGKSRVPYFVKDNELALGIYDMQEKARAAGGQVQAIAERIAGEHDAVCTPINFKSYDSMSRKVRMERQQNPEYSPYSLKDAVRTTIVAPEGEIPSILEELRKYEGCAVKHQLPENNIGYSGYIVNLPIGGIKTEIQVNTAAMIFAKNTPESAKKILGEDVWNSIREKTGMEGGLGHKFYEEYRVLNPNSKAAMAIAEKSRKYYEAIRRLCS